MKQVLILPFVLLLVSCSTVDSETKEEITSENLVLQTDKTKYTATVREDLPPVFYGFSLVARFENNTDQTLYLNRCDLGTPPIYGLKLFQEEDIQTSYRSVSFICAGGHNPIMVKSGSVRIDTLGIRSPKLSDQETKEPIGLFEGTFQLLYDVWTCKSGDRCDLPNSLSESNEFEVLLAE